MFQEEGPAKTDKAQFRKAQTGSLGPIKGLAAPAFWLEEGAAGVSGPTRP